MRVIPLYKPCTNFSHVFSESWQGLEVECFILEPSDENYTATPSTVFMQEESEWVAINFRQMMQLPPKRIIFELPDITANMILSKINWIIVYPDAVDCTKLCTTPLIKDNSKKSQPPVLVHIVAYYNMDSLHSEVNSSSKPMR